MKARDTRLAELEDMLNGKEGEVTDLDDMIKSKDQLIKQLENELLDMEERRRREEEERRRKELEALNAQVRLVKSS